jgi:hypothetical protein
MRWLIKNTLDMSEQDRSEAPSNTLDLSDHHPDN